MENKAKSIAPIEALDEKQLKAIVSQLSAQNRALVEQNNQMRQALAARDLDYSSFFLSMLFKVLDHTELYETKFVKWCTDNIQAALISFAEASAAAQNGEEPKADKASDEKQES